MAGFNTEETGVTRAVAIEKITALAKEKGYKGAFKVLYNGSIIADPSELPESVDMSKVKIANVLDQA